MKIEQMYTNCLAEAAYYIESDGEAAVIDPIRETEPYLQRAEQGKAKIKYVFETHFHADFVSGHIDLAKKTGAKIVFGPTATPKYEAYIAKDNEEFKIGKITIKVLHTPGHTPESSCYLLTDENGKNHAIFTGDTLFVGDVGRPDLLDGKISKEELAGMLYESLSNKIKTLEDEVIVYPGHGPGSSCGKNIGKETWSTIGIQKKTNYALQKFESKNAFVKAVTDGLASPPGYFFKDAVINKSGYENIDDVLKRNINPLSVAEFKNAINKGAMVLDTRDPDEFEKAFIQGSINVGLNGSFAVWVGTVVPVDKQLVVVCDNGKEHECMLRLARVGYENIAGYLKGGIDEWKKENETNSVNSVNSREFLSMVESKDGKVLDVRKKGEYNNGHLDNVTHICLSQLTQNIQQLTKNDKYLVHCAGGYRSMIAASILKANGFNNIINLKGGFEALKKETPKIIVEENAVC